MNNIDRIEVTKETQSTAPIAFTSAVEDSKENKRINKERTEQQRKTVKDFLKTINTKDIERTNLDESLFNENNDEVDISEKNIKVDNEVDLKALLDEYMSKHRSYDKVGDSYEYEIYADYNDELSDRTILKALKSNDPYYEIEYEIDDAYDYGADYRDELYKDFTEFLIQKDVDYDSDEVIDYLNEYVYFVPPYDHFFGQEVECHLIVDTGDANADFTLNPNDMTTEEEIDDLYPNASIVWLAETQGYDIEQLKEALRGNYGDSKFLKSVYEEMINNIGSLSALTFLLKATVKDLLRVKEESLDVKVSPSVECGFFDVLNGSGSTLEIELEKPVTIPNKYIWAFEPDAKGSRVAYTVDDVYGISGSAYKDAYEIVGEKQTK